MGPVLEENSQQWNLLKERVENDPHLQAVRLTISCIDLKVMRDAYRGTGSIPYPPDWMLAIALFMILRGEPSPSSWFKAAKESDACKFLGHGITPSCSTWYNFRDRAAQFIAEVHAQTIRKAIQRKTIEPTQGCLDGTMVAACASRHTVLRVQQVSKRLNIIKRAIATKDDKKQVASSKPLNHYPRWLGKTASGRKKQLLRYRLAKRRLLDEIQANRKLPKSIQRDEERIALSPADLDAVIGKDKKNVTRPIYNVQYMCDLHSDVIVSYGLFRKKNDTGTLVPMIKATRKIVGDCFAAVHADAGYCSILEIEDAQRLGIELFAPVPNKTCSNQTSTRSGLPQLSNKEFKWCEEEKKLTCPAGYEMKLIGRSQDPRADHRCVIELRFEQSESKCSGCALADRCLSKTSQRRTIRRLENQELLTQQAEKMSKRVGTESSLMRKIRVERRFADSKRHRGGEAFHGRNIHRVTAEIGLTVVAQNSLSIYNMEQRKFSPVA